MMKNILWSFFALFSLLSFLNCAPKVAGADSYQREWMLVKFQNFSKETLTQNKATLNLSDSENPGKFSANMGCNNMFGEAKFNSDKTVKFSALGSTMMYCDNAMNLESAFQNALPMMSNYTIAGHYLTLTDSAGNTMKFVAADWD